MLHSRSDTTMRRLLVGLLLSLGAAAPLKAEPTITGLSPMEPGPELAPAVVAQEAATEQADSVVGASIETSDDDAILHLELSDGRSVTMGLRDGGVFVDADRIGDYERGDELSSSWRELLGKAAALGTPGMVAALRGWQAPGGPVAGALATRLKDALVGVVAPAGSAAAGAVDFAAGQADSDSIDRLVARIEQLENERRDVRESRHDAFGPMRSFLDNFLDGLGSLIATLVTYGVLLAIGWVGVYFANLRMERISDVIRRDGVRAGLIGIAAAFLALPVYIVGMLGLVISIVGIPLLLAWAPLFPFALVLATFVGYLAAARAMGESIVERHFTGADWYERANAFYYVAAGLGLLLAPFAIAALLQMTGGLLNWLSGLFFALGIMLNIVVCTIGFGGALIRVRAALDARRRRRAGVPDFEEETHV